MRYLNPITSKIEKLHLVVVIMLMFVILAPTSAQPRSGITASGGAGLFVAADKDYYMGISTDLYPELGIQLDASLIRLGLKCGLIYRKKEIWSWYGYEEYTLSYLPVQAEFLIAPLDMMSKDNLLSPYVGLMAGAFIAIGDNDETLPAFSLKLGSEIHLDPLMAYGDIRYTYAPHNEVTLVVSCLWPD